MLVMSLKFTPVTQSIKCLIFLMYVKTVRRLSYGGQESENPVAGYDSGTPVALKQGHSQQTCYGLVQPKQGYNNAKFGEEK